MPEPAAVDIQDLWFSYNGGAVLREVNLRIERGELACMVGPNGGGKTTLLKLMLGLLRPDRGRVRILGMRPEEARRRVGYVPQHGRLDPKFPVNVMDVVRMGLLGCRGNRGRAAEAAMRALEEVNLADLRRRPFSELSGGQRQRVMIARSLVADPNLLLLDEPTAHLDAGTQADFYERIASLRHTCTVLLVSHDAGFVSDVVGKVICVQGTVATHPTAALTGDLIRELYDLDIRLVRHDHDCMRECPGEAVE
jgi:zinc transport system ATP-binding protein